MVSYISRRKWDLMFKSWNLSWLLPFLQNILYLGFTKLFSWRISLAHVFHLFFFTPLNIFFSEIAFCGLLLLLLYAIHFLSEHFIFLVLVLEGYFLFSFPNFSFRFSFILFLMLMLFILEVLCW